MEVIAISRFVKVSPRKVRLVVDSIRNLSPDRALSVLALANKQAINPIIKTLKAAQAAATNNFKLDSKNLKIKKIEVGEAGALKRFHPVARGRTHPYKKRMSHIRIILEEVDGTKG